MGRVTGHTVHTCILLYFFFALTGCRFQERDAEFKFNPVLRRGYSYSFTITSSQYSRYAAKDSTDGKVDKVDYDTFRLDFALKKIYYTDSLVICKLTFNDFKKKMPRFRIRFTGAAPSGLLQRRSFFAVLDSVGYFIHGHSIQVAINHKGVVKYVDGIETLIGEISRASHEPEGHIKRLLEDYISVNAVKDLLNTLFSVIPNAPVKPGDRWVRNVMLITKAPVKISNLNTLQQLRGDTAQVNTQSIVSAEQSEGGTMYMKGKQNGQALVSYATGMPFLYETSQETVTSTSRYDVVRTAHFLLKQKPLEWK